MVWMFVLLYLSGLLLALLPTAIICQHVAYLYWFRRRAYQRDLPPQGTAFLKQAIQLQKTDENIEFGPRMLFYRYIFPALCIGILGYAWFLLLFEPVEHIQPYGTAMRLSRWTK